MNCSDNKNNSTSSLFVDFQNSYLMLLKHMYQLLLSERSVHGRELVNKLTVPSCFEDSDTG